MIEVTIPNNNVNERKYIIDIFFSEFLGLDYIIKLSRDNIESHGWTIKLDSGNKIIVEDCFFNKYPNDLEYLKLNNLPISVDYAENRFTIEDNIPVIYGTKKIESDKQTIISCGIDIFASSFIMLTRWEEHVNKLRDMHERFPAIQSLAFKYDFLDRPVVNEYVEMLWNMLEHLGIKQQRKKRQFQLYITHDVDELYQWKCWKHVSKVALGDIVKRKSTSLAVERIAEYYLINRGKIKDPFDTFEWLMDKSEAIGVKSRFYFMSGGKTKYDNRYDIKESQSVELINMIKQRGHIIGIHPSYNAYNDFEQFEKELKLLEKVTQKKIVEGREHYLRFEVPTTWQIWEDNGMQLDSTCGYADKEGYRCGTGQEYSVFNILTRKKLMLKERPLVFMDARDHLCGGYCCDTQFDHNLFEYLDKKPMTDTTILFHNNTFKRDMQFTSVYKEVCNVWNKWNNK